MDAAIISDPLRVPVNAQRLEDGRVIIRTPGRPVIIFSLDEVDRLARFAYNKATIQRFRMAPKSRPESPHADDLTLP